MTDERGQDAIARMLAEQEARKNASQAKMKAKPKEKIWTVELPVRVNIKRRDGAVQLADAAVAAQVSRGPKVGDPARRLENLERVVRADGSVEWVNRKRED